MINWLKLWLVIAVIVAVGSLVMAFGAYTVTASAGVAAWMQAIGSVAAIGAAIWIDRGSERRLLEQEERARLRTIADWEACLAQASKLVRNAERIAGDGDGQVFDDTFPARLVDNAIMMIDAYLRQPPPTPQLAFVLAAARSHLEYPRDTIRQRRKIPPEFGAVRLSAVERVRSSLLAATESIETLAEEYGQGSY